MARLCFKLAQPSFVALLLVTFIPVCSAGLPSNHPAVSHPPVPADKAVEKCTECHQDLAHGGPTGLFNKECAVCHSSSSSDPADSSGAGHKERFELEGDVSALKKPADAKAGMRGEMYYDKTRIGAKPNPMVLIPAGEFTMGTNDRLPDEGPEHKVTLPAFYIDKYEVTNLQYKQFIDATNHKSPDHFRNRTYPEGKVDHPVTHVTWYDARDYCQWAGKRLPTEQEWEKAARSPDARVYPWGNDFDIAKANTPQRWMVLEKDGDTTPVGAFPAGVNAYGMYDVSGNVWEWTSSWYKPHPGNTRITENYGEKYKVLKGGSWWDCTFYKCGISAPLYNRSFFLQSTKNKSFGFRCAKDAN
jgi:formylglycine-generating enzyme required for sulfatase activity